MLPGGRHVVRDPTAQGGAAWHVKPRFRRKIQRNMEEFTIGKP